VARRRGIRTSLPPSCDDAGWERLVIFSPSVPFCSGPIAHFGQSGD
jgi:hypothetical protein